jgi:hypothetical protein
MEGIDGILGTDSMDRINEFDVMDVAETVLCFELAIGLDATLRVEVTLDVDDLRTDEEVGVVLDCTLVERLDPLVLLWMLEDEGVIIEPRDTEDTIDPKNPDVEE